MNSAVRNFLSQIVRDGHRECDNGLDSCPKSESYRGDWVEQPIERRPCHCYHDEAQRLLHRLSLSAKRDELLEKSGWTTSRRLLSS